MLEKNEKTRLASVQSQVVVIILNRISRFQQEDISRQASARCTVINQLQKKKKREKKTETFQNKITSLRGLHKNRFSMLFLRDVGSIGIFINGILLFFLSILSCFSLMENRRNLEKTRKFETPFPSWTRSISSYF